MGLLKIFFRESFAVDSVVNDRAMHISDLHPGLADTLRQLDVFGRSRRARTESLIEIPDALEHCASNSDVGAVQRVQIADIAGKLQLGNGAIALQ